MYIQSTAISFTGLYIAYFHFNPPYQPLSAIDSIRYILTDAKSMLYNVTMKPINKTCLECASIKYPRGQKPACYHRDRCRRKRFYYKHLEQCKEYMRNHHKWLKFKKNKCFVCSSTTTLEVHHIEPRCRGGLSVPDNTVTLCGVCHKVITIYETKLGLSRSRTLTK